MWTLVGQRNHVSDGVQILPWEWAVLEERGGPLQSIGTTVHVRWQCGLLSNYFDQLLLLALTDDVNV